MTEPEFPRLRSVAFSSGRIPSELAHVMRMYRKRGAAAAGRLALSYGSVYGRQLWVGLGRERQFTTGGVTLPYFRHWKVTTFINERTVEVPIALHEVQRRVAGRILEVGNVLAQYVAFPHTVVDKYERAPGVLNQDVVDFRSPDPFDLIISVSTLEHVGWDETPRDPAKVVAAVANLRGLLAPGGRMVCTFPLGYNPPLDRLVADRALAFDDWRFLKRINSFNHWREVEWGAVAGSRFSDPYPHANGLVVASASRPA